MLYLVPIIWTACVIVNFIAIGYKLAGEEVTGDIEAGIFLFIIMSLLVTLFAPIVTLVGIGRYFKLGRI